MLQEALTKAEQEKKGEGGEGGEGGRGGRFGEAQLSHIEPERSALKV